MPLSWFKKSVLAHVPSRYRGAGRLVYPGFIQLSAFMQMNVGLHLEALWRLFSAYVSEDIETADATEAFYDEYFAVLDLDADFYLETIDQVFQRYALAEGTFHYQGAVVQPQAIRKTALLTVEGERDDICGMGQTLAAHDLCTGIRPHLHRHHLQVGAGHYGVFSGHRWREQIYPVVKSVIAAAS
jgi:polyhydroxyalkanoate depolymerase